MGECFGGGGILSRWGSIDKNLEVGENVTSRKTATSRLKVGWSEIVNCIRLGTFVI